MTDFEALYALFDGVVPLPADCGTVCGSACCHGDAGCGMRLFPGEPVRLTGATVTPTDDGGRLLVCGGVCRREDRPLACRIFPLFPYVTETGRIRAVYDPAAYRICPLVRRRENVPLRRDFVRAVRKAGRLMMRDAACRAFLCARSREIDELNEWLRLQQGRSPVCRRRIK